MAKQISVKEDFAALEKIFIKSIVENPKTPVSVFANLSASHMIIALQEAGKSGVRTSRRHNPALYQCLSEAMENQSFSGRVLAVLLAKTPGKNPFFEKLQNDALDHIAKFPGKAEAALQSIAAQRPDKWEYNPEGIKTLGGNDGQKYVMIDVRIDGDDVSPAFIPTSDKEKAARNLAFVQFWNDYAQNSLVATADVEPDDDMDEFRHEISMVKGAIVPAFNRMAEGKLKDICKAKGYNLIQSEATPVEILGQKGFISTLTLRAGKGSGGAELTATRFGPDQKIAQALAAMSVYAQYENNSLR